MLVCTAHIAGAAALLCALLSSPEKARGSSRKVFTDGLSRPSFRFHATCSFAGSRKASTRRVTNNLPTRASNILCGVRQLCQVKLSQRQMCQVKLSHAVWRQLNLAHLSHSTPPSTCSSLRRLSRKCSRSSSVKAAGPLVRPPARRTFFSSCRINSCMSMVSLR